MNSDLNYTIETMLNFRKPFAEVCKKMTPLWTFFLQNPWELPRGLLARPRIVGERDPVP